MSRESQVAQSTSVESTGGEDILLPLNPTAAPSTTPLETMETLETPPAEAGSADNRQDARRQRQRRQTPPLDPSFLPGGPRSLAAIAVHALGLGLVLAASTLLSIHLALHAHAMWRVPQFLATLCVFHFLEFWTTARYNTPAARVSSFLLFSNGAAYNVAHSCAVLEIVLVSLLFPRWQAAATSGWSRAVGAAMVVVGQVVRSVAMAQAGTNFSHVPAREKREDHELVTNGVYGWLRHPSYFGFFWWAVGTQLVVGNTVCTAGYAAVLWKFFSSRIAGEEALLVGFFGKEYEEFRARTRTGIPFIP